jgi:hypothetical protein
MSRRTLPLPVVATETRREATAPHTAQPRGACTDGERVATNDVAAALQRRGRRAEVTTRWVRRGATWTGLLCAAAGVAASVVAGDHAVLATALAGGALLLLLVDAGGWWRPLRLPIPARATQTLLSPPPHAPGRGAVELLLTVRGDAPARSLAERRPFATVGVERILAAGLFVLAAVAGARIAGADGLPVDLVQMLATVTILVAGALLADRAGARPAPPDAVAADAAIATALAALERLDARPPQRVAVTFVVCGAGALTVRPLLRGLLRTGASRQDLAVLEVRPSPATTPVWWARAGRVLPLRFHPSLLRAATATAAAERQLGAVPVGGLGDAPARVARGMRIGALAVGVPADGDAGVDFVVGVVRRLDAELAATAG